MALWCWTVQNQGSWIKAEFSLKLKECKWNNITLSTTAAMTTMLNTLQ